MAEFTVTDLVRVMREAAGEDDSVDLDTVVLDRTFGELGYDSLAVMETASRVEREFGVDLPEEQLSAIESPKEFIEFVNDRLATAA